MKKKQPQLRKTASKETPPPRAWKVGDRVTKQGMQGTYEITRVSSDGSDVDLCMVGTDYFELFRVRTDLLTPAK
jgi:hypothetical protein